MVVNLDTDDKVDSLIVTILAGGIGKRMNSDLPKVLHMFQNRPMIVRIIEQALLLTPKKILIVTGIYDKLIRDTVLKYLGGKMYQTLTFIVQEQPLGTGDAVRCTIGEYDDTDRVLILNGDMPNIDHCLLSKFIDKSKNNLLLVSKVENPTGYGRILCNVHGSLERIVEEKDANENEKNIDTINTGIYCLKGSDLKRYIIMIDNCNNQREYYLTTIIELLISDNIVVDTYTLEKNDSHTILGVNTVEQLKFLEQCAKNVKKQ